MTHDAIEGMDNGVVVDNVDVIIHVVVTAVDHPHQSQPRKKK
jgi:hypothetical protein